MPYFFQGETAETIAFFQDTLAFPQQSDRPFPRERSPLSQRAIALPEMRSLSKKRDLL
ncbi:hypothetical protein [Oxynema aestuarii]|uniref:Uncharacterized protein n=1 Tax=Oxynema aestuarii AP17 TaxID=2064643 RepID=A0A6H1TWU8_9CYAN|nr:hypothetical protein [Oxynema aestuarii]QIZ71088.1 hypothetical protein HCG48_11320 [Oxynema aestuarii AP17]